MLYETATEFDAPISVEVKAGENKATVRFEARGGKAGAWTFRRLIPSAARLLQAAILVGYRRFFVLQPDPESRRRYSESRRLDSESRRLDSGLRCLDSES